MSGQTVMRISVGLMQAEVWRSKTTAVYAFSTAEHSGIQQDLTWQNPSGFLLRHRRIERMAIKAEEPVISDNYYKSAFMANRQFECRVTFEELKSHAPDVTGVRTPHTLI